MSEPLTTEQYQQALADDYGQYVAKQPIYHDGALAYDTGHPVPASNVKLHGYDKNGLVAKRGTKAADAATEEKG